MQVQTALLESFAQEFAKSQEPVDVDVVQEKTSLLEGNAQELQEDAKKLKCHKVRDLLKFIHQPIIRVLTHCHSCTHSLSFVYSLIVIRVLTHCHSCTHSLSFVQCRKYYCCCFASCCNLCCN
jgi:hypothetical protein